MNPNLFSEPIDLISLKEEVIKENKLRIEEIGQYFRNLVFVRNN